MYILLAHQCQRRHTDFPSISLLVDATQVHLSHNVLGLLLDSLRERHTILNTRSNIMSLQELIKFAALRLRNIIDVNGNVIAKLGGNLLKRETCCLGEVEIDDGNEEDAPGDDDEVVLPAHLFDADGSCL